MAISRRQAYPHWHPEAFDGPCNHDAPLAEFPDGRYAWPYDYPPLTWPNVVVIAFGVVAILVAVALVGVAFVALAGPGQ